MSDLPDYYAVLEVAPTATEEQIKTAYKKAALKWHPDRVAMDSPERPSRTKKFQRINDAYYTLSDASRRRDYDDARKWHTGTSSTFEADEADEEVPRPPPQSGAGGAGGFFSGFPWSAFGGGGGASADGTQEQKFSDAQFGSVFEEMLHDDLADGEGDDKKPNGRFWSIVGTLSGAAMGFIIANVPGATAGGVAGNRLGHLRDVKGQSVYSTFQQLPQNEKAKLLSELAAKIFAGAIS